MANKTFLGKSQVQEALDDEVPSAGAGIAMSGFTGTLRADRWLVSAEIIASSPTDAELDLGGEGSGQLDTIVEPRSLHAGDGNGITVATQADSAAGDGVTIEEDLDALAVVIHYEDGVSTVADVEAAIADSTLIQVKTTGTAATVLVGADEITATALAGGTDSANTYSLLVHGRDPTTKKWGLHSDQYGHVSKGSLGTGLAGRQNFIIRDLGVYDRVAFTRETGGSDDVNVTLTEVLSAGRGN